MLTVEGLVAELGLKLVSGEGSAQGHIRWVHSTELPDPTPWLRGGELLLTTGLQLQPAKAQRELIARLAEHEIGGLGFGTGFAHKRLPPALADEARKRDFPLFEVPYELPFIAITERVFAQLLDERYEMLQRSMAGDVLAEALTGRLYPEELQARLRPFGIGERAAVLAFAPPDPAVAAPLVERMLAHEQPPLAGSLVAIRTGLLCAVVDGGPPPPANGAHAGEHHGAPGELDPIALARRIRAELAARLGGDVRASASRVAPAQSLRLSFHEARCALEAMRLTGYRPPQRRGGGRLLRRPRRLPAAALVAGRRRAADLLPRRAWPGGSGRGRVRRRAAALAGRVHRAQRPLGEGGQRAVLPPPHAALPHPPRGAAHRP